jgi:colicin import membrane protein
VNDLSNGKYGSHTGERTRKARVAAASGIVLALSVLSVQAQTGAPQSMEERLRAQLRATTTQLQQAQAELARLKSSVPAPSAAATGAVAEDIQKQLAQAKAQLAAERARARRLEAEHSEAKRDVASEQVVQLRDANTQLQKATQDAESERRRLASETATKDSALQRCEAKNKELYALGQEVLHAYETVDFGTVFSTRQPFASKARAKYGQIAQDYGDRLHQGRFDPSAAETPATDNAAKP